MLDADSSAARPSGSMAIERLYWWVHSTRYCNDSIKYSSRKIHNSVSIKLKDNVDIPTNIDDFDIIVDTSFLDDSIKLEII